MSSPSERPPRVLAQAGVESVIGSLIGAALILGMMLGSYVLAAAIGTVFPAWIVAMCAAIAHIGGGYLDLRSRAKAVVPHAL